MLPVALPNLYPRRASPAVATQVSIGPWPPINPYHRPPGDICDVCRIWEAGYSAGCIGDPRNWEGSFFAVPISVVGQGRYWNTH